MLNDYKYLQSKLQKMNDFKFTEYRDAVSMVHSRSWEVRLDGEDVRIFIPFVDMMNHDEEKSQIRGGFKNSEKIMVFYTN